MRGDLAVIYCRCLCCEIFYFFFKDSPGVRAQDPECTFCEKTNNAYPLLKSLSIPFSGTDAWDEYNDSYNFHLSQLRICIEMCFGRLTTKWRIFRSKLLAAHGTAKNC